MVSVGVETPWMQGVWGKDDDSWACLRGGYGGIILNRGNGRGTYEFQSGEMECKIPKNV